MPEKETRQTRPASDLREAIAPQRYLTFSPVRMPHAIWIPVFLATVALSLSIADMLVARINWINPGKINPDILRFLNLNEEANLPAWFASSLWLTSAFLAFAVWQKHREHSFPHGVYWIAMVPLFVFLSVDEAGKIHESIGAALGNSVETYGYTYAWVAFGAALVLAVGLFNLRLLFRLRTAYAVSFILAAGIFITGAVVIESIGAAVEYGRLEQIPFGHTWRRLVAVEETLEMLGVILLIHTLLRILADPAAPYRGRQLPS